MLTAERGRPRGSAGVSARTFSPRVVFWDAISRVPLKRQTQGLWNNSRSRAPQIWSLGSLRSLPLEGGSVNPQTGRARAPSAESGLVHPDAQVLFRTQPYLISDLPLLGGLARDPRPPESLHVGEQVTGPRQEAGTFTSRLTGDLAARAHPLCWPGWPASPHPTPLQGEGRVTSEGQDGS